MSYVIAAFLLGGFLISIVAFALSLGYDVELTFHPPIFVKLKLNRTNHKGPRT